MKTCFIRTMLFLSMLFLLYGNASGEDESARLQGKGNEYWNARATFDWEKVYSFMSPGEKQRNPPEEYIKTMKTRNAFKLVEWQVLDAKTENDRGWVEVKNTLEYLNYPGLPQIKNQFWQPWRKIDGIWYALNVENADIPRLPPHMRNAEAENHLMKRVSELWVAKHAGDWAKAYEFCDPEFKKANPIEDFLKRTPIYSYVAYDLEWVEAIDKKGRAKVNFLYRSNDPSLAKMDSLQATNFENWVLVDGEWYLSIKEKAE